ncbi:MAG: hypothetical protein ACLQAT_13055 [Candidatus Binataceae bacterium]
MESNAKPGEGVELGHAPDTKVPELLKVPKQLLLPPQLAIVVATRKTATGAITDHIFQRNIKL